MKFGKFLLAVPVIALIATVAALLFLRRKKR
jgi:hypothetical protein